LKGQRGYWKRFTLASFIGIFFLIIFLGCAKKEAIRKISDEEILKERVTTYWNHKVKRDFVKAYEYESPLSKEMTATKYVQMHANPALTYKSFEIRSIIKKADDIADVELMVVPVAKVPGAKPFEHEIAITERWVKVNDTWYHLSRRAAGDFTHK